MRKNLTEYRTEILVTLVAIECYSTKIKLIFYLIVLERVAFVTLKIFRDLVLQAPFVEACVFHTNATNQLNLLEQKS